jgi:hypothetical protein
MTRRFALRPGGAAGSDWRQTITLPPAAVAAAPQVQSACGNPEIFVWVGSLYVDYDFQPGALIFGIRNLPGGATVSWSVAFDDPDPPNLVSCIDEPVAVYHMRYNHGQSGIANATVNGVACQPFPFAVTVDPTPREC